MIHDSSIQVAVAPIIRKAGEILLSYYQQPCDIRVKIDESIVTQADLASEKYLISALSQVLPEASFHAEESGVVGDRDYCWVIDPLDGTTNFSRGLHHFCISVALTYKGTPVFGAVYQPVLNELFYAQQGQGAFLNGIPLVMPENPGQRGVFAVGAPHMKQPYITQFAHDLELISGQAHSVRTFGAIALDQAYVACGRVDAVVFRRFGWWDVAAGMLLIAESGGKVTDFGGKMVCQSYDSFIGAHPATHEKLLTALQCASEFEK